MAPERRSSLRSTSSPPEIDEDGRLSFEIPYSRYAWNAEAKAWQIVEEDDEEDEEEEPEDVARFRSHERLGERLSVKY